MHGVNSQRENWSSPTRPTPRRLKVAMWAATVSQDCLSPVRSLRLPIPGDIEFGRKKPAAQQLLIVSRYYALSLPPAAVPLESLVDGAKELIVVLMLAPLSPLSVTFFFLVMQIEKDRCRYRPYDHHPAC